MLHSLFHFTGTKLPCSGHKIRVESFGYAFGPENTTGNEVPATVLVVGPSYIDTQSSEGKMR